MRVLLSGATGFVGGRLAQPLVDAGHELRAMTRRPDAYRGPGTAVAGDTGDADSLEAAMRGCDAAYYLVHGLDDPGDFERADAAAARAFGTAARAAGVRQLIYLGGLGRQGDDLSDHLASRQEVEGRLGQGGVPVTTLRAALVIGAGSASFELLRQVVRGLPVVVLPPHARSTRVQPISVDDVVRYLVGVLGNEAAVNGTFEVGGPDVVTYEAMLRAMARRLGRRAPVLAVPFVPRTLARLGVRLVTDVDPQLALTLLDSMGNDVVVTDGGLLAELLPGQLRTFEEMLDDALAAEVDR